MIHVDELQARVKQLTERTWDVLAIQARHQKLLESGITRKAIDWREIITQKEQILERIQFRAEEYEYFGHN
jgi:hypothetical protein